MLKIIKKIGKIAAALGLVALLAGQVISAPLKTMAEAPRFNFLDGDKELFTGRNYTAGETVYTDPVNSNGNDELVGLIYYHNGVVAETARNTTVKVTLPATTAATAKVLNATITADNSDPKTISDTIVNNQIVGQSGLTVNVPEADSKISFVPGSVRWFPNKSETPVELPAGVNGDSLISSGLNIGDVQGCWQFSGYISFGLKVLTPVHPIALAIEKTVRNQTLDQDYVKLNEARPEDILSYKVVVRNSGEKIAENVLLKDVLPAEVTYVPNSIHLYANGSQTETAFHGNDGNNVVTAGASIGSLNIGLSSKVIFSVKIKSSGLENGQILTNRATATSGEITLSDEAKTKVIVTSALIVKSKSAFNETQNVDATTAIAKSGDVIRYQLVTKNIGNGDGVYTPVDGIADILEYADLTDLGGGTRIDNPNATNDDDKVEIRYPEVSIAPNASVVSEFVVMVKNPLPNNPQSGHHFDWVMYNYYGNSVTIQIKLPVVVHPNLTLVKDVRDVTTNEISFTDRDSVFAGDTLEYRIIITNPTSISADGAKIVDTLPANVVYIPGTTVLSKDGSLMTVVDGITASGIIFPQIPANSTYTLYLRAKIDSGVAGNTDLVNLATVTSGDINISDTAASVTKAPVVLASVPPTQSRLPVTGASGVLGSLFGSIFLISNMVYFKGKKDLLSAAVSAHS